MVRESGSTVPVELRLDDLRARTASGTNTFNPRKTIAADTSATGRYSRVAGSPQAGSR